ncbi:hypothetical protein SLEP1_g24306 [Rubroshorea leprosula]|uniref:Uncharacterized protein n=1 Tax=Rubroshorea leprosula TaxID=152421 RepID=A0AAV5JIA3_9ROSI|nr:hypothetical protein SLEP1_g24306 [Rubroshorea leprosula]
MLYATIKHGLKKELPVHVVTIYWVQELQQALYSAIQVLVQLTSLDRRISLNQLIYIFRWNIALGLFARTLNHIIILTRS